MRILSIVHYHPRIRASGSAWVAYDLAQHYASKGHESYFLGGRMNERRPQQAVVAAVESSLEHDFSFDVDIGKFNKTRLGSHISCQILKEWIGGVAPDIIHFHSMHSLGHDTLRSIVPETSKKPQCVLTLHNYSSICANNGWMITPQNDLCTSSSPEKCHTCFPHISPKEFELHSEMAQSLLNSMDMLVTPSQFAQDRYREWGFDPARITVIPNGQNRHDHLPRTEHGNLGQLRLGYFGQIGLHKGLHIILSALLLLPFRLRESGHVHLNIFGSNMTETTEALPDYSSSFLPRDYVTNIRDSIRALGDMVTFHGTYDRDNIAECMRQVDWIVVPSIQWENQPLTILEAFSYGRPVLCSNIGGMAELVRDQVNGLHFKAGDANDLSEKLIGLLNKPDLWHSYRANIRHHASVGDAGDRYLNLFDSIRRAT